MTGEVMATRVVTVNPGSSSVKLAVVENGTTVAGTTIDAASAGRAGAAIAELALRSRVDAVGVRFVHGGDHTSPVVLDDAERARLATLVPLAPLHQPLSLALVDAVARILPHTPVVACFDTSFHASMPEAAAQYALPRNWVRLYGLRRYGFHGLSCAYALRRCAAMLDSPPDSLRILCCHIGAGVSVTAIRGGHGVDTSMGFTPLDGAVMATRSGSVDPGLLLYLLRNGVADVASLDQALDRRSGLAGMTGTGGDVRDVLAARTAGDPAAALAIEVYLHRLRREMGAMSAALDRLDAVVFTGGVAEHQPGLLAELVDGVPMLGVALDMTRLRLAGDRVISSGAAELAALVVTAREDLEIARQTVTVLAAPVAARPD